MMAAVEPSARWPIAFADVLLAENRIRRHVAGTPLRSYAPLDAAVGHGIHVRVKHENHAPTNSFKIRNALSVMTRLSEEARRRGVVTATRGNHGLGVAYAGSLLGIPATIFVPRGNNPEKNEGMRGFGAELVEEGRDYDEALAAAEAAASERGLHMIHSTNDPDVIAGAATCALEILRGAPRLDALVVSIGGGSQAVGAMTVARALSPGLAVYGVQAAGASAAHDSWRARRPVTTASADTFADGVATRNVYTATFGPLCEGLADFVTVPDAEIAEALRLLLKTTHTLVEGAGAAGMAGLMRLRERLAGRTVGIVLSGGNIDRGTLERVLGGAV
jgi:threonine dehydratase